MSLSPRLVDHCFPLAVHIRRSHLIQSVSVGLERLRWHLSRHKSPFPLESLLSREFFVIHSYSSSEKERESLSTSLNVRFKSVQQPKIRRVSEALRVLGL